MNIPSKYFEDNEGEGYVWLCLVTEKGGPHRIKLNEKQKELLDEIMEDFPNDENGISFPMMDEDIKPIKPLW